MREAAQEDRRSTRVLVGLTLLAIVVRWWRWVHTEVIFADGPRFLAIAQAAGAGDWEAVLADDFHPLYSLLIAAVQPAVGDWELAAVLVSIVSGALAVAFLYELTRSAFGAGPAWIAGVMLALHPTAVDFSSDVQSEGLYTACFVGALWLGWRAIEDRSLRWAAGCGLLSGLAYLVRPEGLGAAGIIGAVGVFEVLRGRLPFARALGCAGAIAAGALLAAAPYVWSLSEASGELTLTRKKSIAVILGIQDAPATAAAHVLAPSASLPALLAPTDESSSPPPDGLLGAVEIARKAIKSMRYEVLLLLGIGLWSVRGWPGQRGRFFGALVGVYGVVLFGLFMSAGYVSRRHWLPVVVPLLGYAALGVPVLGGALLRLVRRPAASPWAAATVGLSIIAIAAVIELSDVRAERHLAERRAGERVAASATRPPVVAAKRRYAAYYAGGRHLPIQPSRYTLDPGLLQERGATHVIVHESALDPDVWAEVLAQPGLLVIDRFDAHGRTALVIEVEPAEPQAPALPK